LGGKHDDITITVAQIFRNRGQDDPRRRLAEQDTYFKEQKTIYTGPVPFNTKEGFMRARFREYVVPEGAPWHESVEQLRAKAEANIVMIRMARANQAAK